MHILRWLIATLLLVGALAGPAYCEDDSVWSAAFRERSYAYGGVDVGPDTSYAWMGMAWAPMGTMNEEGLRLRLQGGSGRYSYATDAVPGGWNGATKYEGELLAGRQFLFGPQALALYAGVNLRTDVLDQPDPSNRDQGTHIGLKLVGEWFWRPATDWVVTAAAGGSTADETLSGRATAGRKFADWLEAGSEAMASADWFSSTAGAGLYVATPLPGRQWRASGGWRWSSDSAAGPYMTLSLFQPF